MRLKTLELNGFKSFAQKTVLDFHHPIVAVVGPNGSGKSNVVEAFRFVLGEQSMKSMRGKAGSDLIFKGSKNLAKASHASVSVYFNNADKVFHLANDSGEEMNLNFDTVSISREVFLDGLNKYVLNGSDVRLKDIHNLLASVNLGSSQHQIISQGEADRILNANSRERKEMVEDALGLKIYQLKIKESERKLERTEENMKEVGIQRRENAPHLNFLKKQVEKFEKAKDMQAELLELYKEYLKRESVYLETEKQTLSKQKRELSDELETVNRQISKTENDSNLKGNKKIEELREIEQKINGIRGMKSELERKLGRIEGMLEAEERRAEMKSETVEISQEEIKNIVEEINESIEQAFVEESISEIKFILSRIKEILGKFSESGSNSKKRSVSEQVLELKGAQAEILAEMRGIEIKEKENTKIAEKLKQEINAEMEALRDLEREKFTHKVREQELVSGLQILNIKEIDWRSRMEAFETEIKEGVALIGEVILAYKDSLVEEGRASQEELKHKIERIKIKLEDAGLGSGAELMKEYQEVSERDQFLEKELADLEKSIEALEKLIAELKEKIDVEFKEGVKKINVEFQELFALMFGGGHASLSIVLEQKRKRSSAEDEDEIEAAAEAEEETVAEPGIEINVSLPHKKVKELNAFSGGERSLTSIAILFAMSQVNPPPFLVLDETDAALDEANSRKYGDMLEKLSKRSQLIVVTHNRETMSRAGVLYGVTIGSDGASKLLSIKFKEATQIAK